MDPHTTTNPLRRALEHEDAFSKNRIITEAIQKVKQFYNNHDEIKTSHGWDHIQAVYNHTTNAIQSLEYTIPYATILEIQLAALLHDVDDKKYFPNINHGEYPNARALLNDIGITSISTTNSGNTTTSITTTTDLAILVEQKGQCDSNINHEQIIQMISWVGCSENGNLVPKYVSDHDTYHLLIPRWADRLEAVGSRGVVRCYQYNQEKGQPLSSPASPRPQTEDELWSKHVKESRLVSYMNRGGTSQDMISHYYDKLLHISRPPKHIVRNPYLESQAESSSKDLVEVCLRYGRTGIVDEDFIQSLMVSK